MYKTRIWIVAMTLLLPLSGWAQTQQPVRPAATVAANKAPSVTYRKLTVYDKWDDEEVPGTLVRPDGDMADSLRHRTQGPLLRPRLSFVPELVRSAENL